MTLREIIEAIDREAERALVGYPLDLDAELEVKGQINGSAVNAYDAMRQDVDFIGRSVRIERLGSRVFLVIE